MADPFERLADESERALDGARAEAQRLGHAYVGTEHLLLGLVADGSGAAGRALRQLGVEPESARRAVEFIFGRAETTVATENGWSPVTTRVVKRAAAEARRTNQPTIGTGHLLLGLIREACRGAGVLRVLGVNLERLRLRVLAEMGTGSPHQPPRPTATDEPEQSWSSQTRDGGIRG